MFLLKLFLFTILFNIVNGVTCDMGYGQRGLNYASGITWPRSCEETTYCWQTTTNDIQLMKDLFDYQWDPYYEEYYIKGCGGEWGSPKKNPYILVDPILQVNGRYTDVILIPKNEMPFVTLNITRNSTITTIGGHAVMPMTYACETDYCSSSSISYEFISYKLIFISCIGILNIFIFS